MATRKIASGDTTTKIAQQYGISVDQLMSLNTGNASVRSKDLIFAGGNINIPDSGSTPAAPTGGTQGGGVTATPPNSISDGMSASFADFSSQIKNVGTELSKLSEDTSSLYSDTGADEEARKRSADTIERGYELSRQEISDTNAKGQLDRSKALDLLQMNPAAVKYNIDQFTVQSDNFTKAIDRSIERLQLDEDAALANNDYQYAQQIRQNKLDYYNARRTALTDKMSMISSAYSMMLTGYQTQQTQEQNLQTEASNKLNLIIQSGQKYSELSPDDKAAYDEAVKTLGVSPALMAGSLGQTEVAHVVSKGDYTYFYDKGGNLVRSAYTPDSSGVSGGLDAQTIFQGYMDGNLRSVPAKYQPYVQSQINSITNSTIGNLAWQFRNEQTNTLGTQGSSVQSEQGQKDSWAKTTADRISKIPQEAGKLLGLNYTPLSITNDMKSQLEKIARDTVEAVYSDSYIANGIRMSKMPYIDVGSLGGQ